MPGYLIVYKPSAAKAFRKLHSGERKRTKEAVEDPAMDPRPQRYIQLSGRARECRIRVGPYRIVYDIEDDELVILVLQIGLRREVYR